MNYRGTSPPGLLDASHLNFASLPRARYTQQRRHAAILHIFACMRRAVPAYHFAREVSVYGCASTEFTRDVCDKPFGTGV